MVCFTLELGPFTSISWSGGRVVSGRAVTYVLSVGMFSGATLFSIGTHVCCSV